MSIAVASIKVEHPYVVIEVCPCWDGQACTCEEGAPAHRKALHSASAPEGWSLKEHYANCVAMVLDEEEKKAALVEASKDNDVTEGLLGITSLGAAAKADVLRLARVKAEEDVKVTEAEVKAAEKGAK